MDGMVTWRFGLVMESLALMLQGSLLLLGYALSNYLFVINRVVAGVVIGFTSLGALFYLIITLAATRFYNCPFQTPFSRTFRFLIRFDDEHTRYLKRSREWSGRCLRLLGRTFSQMEKRTRPQSGGLRGWGGADIIPGDQIELPMASSDARPLLHEETNRNSPALDMDCVPWILEMSKDVDVTMDIAGHIPEFAWDATTWSIPPKMFYNAMRSCFDHSLGYLTLKPTFRYQAYTSAKAFLHLCIQSKYVAPESEKADFEPIPRMHQSAGSERHEGDSDLESVLGVIGYVLGDPKPMDWHKFSFTVPHHCWMGHILLYRAWDVLGNDEPLPDDIRGFVLHSLQLEPPPPKPIVADCLFIIGLVLGIELHRDDLSVVDKRTVIPPKTRSTALWRSWSSSYTSLRAKSWLKRVTSCSTSSCRHPPLSSTPRRRSGKPLVSPCTGPTSGTSPCRRSANLKTSSPSWVITPT
ncbi:hypothetical protein BDM02DRAFT_390427 [Thelephora ganbajun]|uniref:Uncharacterized protein n=1 Tax=Thelephora ganbajun TaxID=370292 RepID=A0ACB6Z846_THEGA|nr:hypothetical protein BDM02DRAFT_390427 [Thelephora ganbajun]